MVSGAPTTEPTACDFFRICRRSKEQRLRAVAAAYARPVGDPLALMDRLTAAQNAHHLEGMLACFHEDYRSEQPLFPARTFQGIAQVRANWSALLEGIPDFHAEILRSAAMATPSLWRSTGREPRRTARRLRSVVS